MPSTVPVWVVLGDARSCPYSIATPSNPSCAGASAVVVEVVEVAGALVLLLRVVDVLLLLAQPARSAALASASTSALGLTGFMRRRTVASVRVAQ